MDLKVFRIRNAECGIWNMEIPGDGLRDPCLSPTLSLRGEMFIIFERSRQGERGSDPTNL